MRDQSHEAVYLAFILTRLIVALGPSGSRFGSPNTQTIQRHALEDHWKDEEAPVAIVFENRVDPTKEKGKKTTDLEPIVL